MTGALPQAIEHAINELREAEWKSGDQRGSKDKSAYAEHWAGRLRIAIAEALAATPVAQPRAEPIYQPEPQSDLSMSELRALRLWHWRKVLRASKNIAELEKLGWCTYQMTQQRVNHRNHLRWVQALNSVFPIGDTAEQDDIRFPDTRGRKKK